MTPCFERIRFEVIAGLSGKIISLCNMTSCSLECQ
jgi:hypothetical protein